VIEAYEPPAPRKPASLSDVRKPEICTCEHTEMRHLVCTNGVIQYKPQCLKCGIVGNPVAHSSLTKEQQGSAKPVDEAIAKKYRDRYWREWNTAREALREWTQSFWEWYATYVESDCWKRRRTAVLERDHFLCTSCEKRPAIIAHHLSYERAGREPLFDLVSVCYECHEQIHGRPL
jgi:5-methylcytosine-specific restriction endonuclease McrA